MKRVYSRFMTLGVGMLLSLFLPSCLDTDDEIDFRSPTALVTVCPEPDGSFTMQLDDKTRLIPTNIKSSPFGTKEVRALVNYTETESRSVDKDIRSVRINWLDSIRTKLPVVSVGEDDDAEYGHDPLDIVYDWVTVAEDGYLTLRIRTLWGATGTQHMLNLITGINPSDPYEFEIRHDAKGDISGHWGDVLIAFNLNNLPKPDGGVTKVKLRWKSFTGDKSVEFDIRMRP